MTTLQLLSQLADHGVRVWVENGRVRVRGPRDALTPELREELEGRRAAILALLARTGVVPAGDAPPLVPAPRVGDLPLSFAQRQIWFLYRLDPGGAAYNVTAALQLDGALDAGVLDRALTEVCARHEALRTVFADGPQGPVQRVLPPAPVALDRMDLPDAEDLAPARRAAAAEAERPFDLERERPFRATLLRLAADRHVLVVGMHHIASDGWSVGVLVREVAALYRAFAKGRPSPLPPLPVQYADYAIWQREWLRGEVLDAQVAWWRERLAGAPVLRLPTDRPRPALPTRRGARHPLVIPQGVSEQLASFVAREGLTPFMALLTAWTALLSRYTGESDVVVGSPVAGRTRPQVERLIGFFANTLVLRVDLSGDPSFRVLSDRVRETVLEALAHQDLPFEKLVEELRPERTLGQNPLFQVMFSLQSTPAEPLSLPGVAASLLEVENRTAKFDLTLHLAEGPDGLQGALEYAEDLFDASTAARMAEHLGILLAGALAAPELQVSDLPLLSAAEERRLVLEWGRPSGRFEGAHCLHQLFEAQADRVPGRVAAVRGEERLTYAALDARANRLAHHLRALGAAPGERVVIALDRGLPWVAAVLAVLKTGAAYVPCDPTYPAERLRWVLRDTRARVLVAEDAVAEALAGACPHVVRGGAEAARIAALPATRPAPAGDPDHPAYVIYTSGSTGAPKGVVVTHRMVARLFAATQAWFGFGEDDVWTLFHSGAFDFSVWELWGALLHGGRLVVVPFLTSRSPEDFHELVRREGVTVLNQTPSAFRQFAQADAERGAEGGAALRWVIFGGEALDFASLGEWFARHGDRRPRLVNMYGITETTVHVTYRPLSRADAYAGGSLMGGPIPDMELYLLDPRMRPVPIGVPGEVYVGGAGVALGYLNRPALTAARFVPHPFSDRPGARLYRSGDLARRSSSGELEYLGRIDQQVKIRGHRIELGEVEAALGKHPAVRWAVIAARDEGGGERRLVAYLVPRAETPSVSEVRSWLRERLPDPMIPAAWVFLPALPLTSNGKVDRKALPAPETARPGPERERVLPRTPAEQVLAEVWSEVLGVPTPGVHDNFFELGGDSIRSIQVIAGARRRGLELALPDLFRHQVLADLAAAALPAGAPGTSPQGGGLVLLSGEDRAHLPEGVVDAYPLTQLQAGMLFHSGHHRGATTYHNVSSLHLRGRPDTAALRAALDRLAARHPVLRTSFALAGFREPLQLVHARAAVPLEVEDLSHLAPEAQSRHLREWMRAEQRRGWNWEHTPQLRFFVHLRGPDSFQLTWSFHHAILDGWSIASMLTQLFAEYRALTEGDTPGAQWTALDTFREYVALEREALASPAALRFWEDALRDAPPSRLPRWRPPREDTRPEGQQRLTVAAGVAAGLRALAASASVPLKSVLLAAHLRVLAATLGSDDVVTGVVSHGRPETEDGHRALGLFLNSIPLRRTLHPGSWLDLARDALAAEQESLPYRRFPLPELQRRVGGGRPLFEVLFNYLHFHVHDAVRAVPGLEVLEMESLGETSVTLGATFWVDPSGRLHLLLEYDPRELDDEQVAALLRRYAAVLEAMATDPHAPWERVLLSDPEEQRLLPVVPAGESGEPDSSLGGAWALAARAHAGRVALEHGARALSYAELDALSATVAFRVRAAGGGPEARVAVLAEDPVRRIAALLGVLRAGAAVVPLDSAYPAEALRYALSDSGARAVLVEPHLADWVDGGPPLVLLDQPPAREAGPPDGEPACPALHPRAAAYVIYTSGSTGRPKGVVVEHAAALQHLREAARAYGIGPEDVVLHFAAPAFDVTLEQVFAALLSGARLVARGTEAWTPEELTRRIRTHRVTVANLPTQFFHLWARWSAEHPEQAPAPTLRLVIAGGEALSTACAAVWARGPLGRIPLLNAYGPTEAIVTATTLPVTPGAAFPGASVPIGAPLPHRSAYVLDSRGSPSPLGTPGELYLGGALLARGYLGRAGLTAERFLPDPFARETGARMYRTGDRARWLPDGVLEYVGRTDRQEKVRGFRIEPGEVEAVLREHAGVREAVVLPRGEAEDRQLVSYLVAAEGTGPAELRTYLAARLPEYMVPSAFVVLDALPVTPNGKVDLRALPEPAGAARRPPVPARTPTEARLVELWAEVLGVGDVGIHDGFWELGGHSLAAVRLVGRISREFGCEIPVGELLRHPTPAAFASLLKGGADVQGTSPVVPLGGRSGEGLPLFLVHAAGGTVTCYVELAQRLGSPVWGVQSPALEGGEEPDVPALEEMANQYIAAVRTVRSHGPYALAGWSLGGVIAYEMACQLRRQGEEVALLALLDSMVPSTRAVPPPSDAVLRALFFRELAGPGWRPHSDEERGFAALSEEEQIAFAVEHGQRMGILASDLEPGRLRHLLRLYVATARSEAAYSPRPYPGRLVLFRAQADSRRPDPALGWGALAAEVSVLSVPGTHLSALHAPHVDVVAEALRAELAGAERIALGTGTCNIGDG